MKTLKKYIADIVIEVTESLFDGIHQRIDRCVTRDEHLYKRVSMLENPGRFGLYNEYTWNQSTYIIVEKYYNDKKDTWHYYLKKKIDNKSKPIKMSEKKLLKHLLK